MPNSYPFVLAALASVCLLFGQPSRAVAQTPDAWRWAPVGRVNSANTVTFAAPGCLTTQGVAMCGRVTVKALGNDLAGASDEFVFAYRLLTGDGTIVTRVDSVTRANDWAKAGLMIRESLAPDARHASLFMSAAKGVTFNHRRTAGGMTVQTAGGSGKAPGWLKIERSGTTITALTSKDGINWVEVGSASMSLQRSVYVGLAVASASGQTATTAVAVYLSVSEWVSTDIGKKAALPEVAYSAGTAVVLGSAGKAIGGTADDFSFYYRRLIGDADIVARVLAVQGTHAKRRAGLMARASLDEDAASVSLTATASKTRLFTRRLETQLAAVTAQTAGVVPGWLKLERRGDVINAFASTDGVLWTFVATEVVPLPIAFYVGLAVTSDAGPLATATFDNVAISEMGTANEAPTVTLTAPAQNALVETGSPVTLVADAADVDGTITQVDFYANGDLVGSDVSAPFEWVWTGAASGAYDLTAIAWDDFEDASESTIVNMTVRPPGGAAKSYRLAFTSRDHQRFSLAYLIAVYKSGANPLFTLPVRTALATPPAIIAGDVVVDVTSMVAALPAGKYFFTVTAIGDVFSPPSAASPLLTR